MSKVATKKKQEEEPKSNVVRVSGWGWPANTKRAHYFVFGRALCTLGESSTRVMEFTGELDFNNTPTPDDCPKCRKALPKN